MRTVLFNVCALLAVTLIACGEGDNRPIQSPAAPSPISSPVTTPVPEPPTPPAGVTPTQTPIVVALAPGGYPPINDEMWFMPVVWIAGAGASGTLRVLIDDVECALETGLMFPDSYGPASFFMKVPSQAVRPGCGFDGATMRLELDGQELPQTVAWRAGVFGTVELVVGGEFARYSGAFTYEAEPSAYTVEPFINGVRCGYQMNLAQGDETYGYDVVVYSDDLRVGCGVDGSVVEMRLFWEINGVAQDIGAIAEVPWDLTKPYARVAPVTVR